MLDGCCVRISLWLLYLGEYMNGTSRVNHLGSDYTWTNWIIMENIRRFNI